MNEMGILKEQGGQIEQTPRRWGDPYGKPGLVIGKTAFIQELYKDYIVDEYDKNYRFKLYDGRVGDEINTKHLVIKNY